MIADFVFSGVGAGDVLVREADGRVSFPEQGDVPRAAVEASEHVDWLSGGDTWSLLAERRAPDGYVLMTRREAAASIDRQTYARMSRAYLMMRFARSNAYCGTCGAKTSRHERELSRVCPVCGALAYPSPAPAMIVAVTKGDSLLMAHNARFKGNMYSVLAGFVEPGESAEDAVVREVWEEARMHVKNVRYFRSQPWPYPNSLMLAYTAEWESGDPTPGDGELSDVRWFARGALPDELPQKISVARALIDSWLGEEGR